MRRFICRKGAATVELAVTLPVIVVIVLGAIEAASLLFARQAMVQSAYEAAVVAIKHDGTNQRAMDAASRVAMGRQIDGIDITFDPNDVSQVARGEPIRVTASAPAGSNRLINSRLLGVQRVSAQAVMIKE